MSYSGVCVGIRASLVPKGEKFAGVRWNSFQSESE